MKKGFMILILAMLWVAGVAQMADVRVPFKAGLKYGVQDGSEKEIIAPVYDDVAVDNELKLIMLNKAGLWGLYNWKGEQLLDHVISASGQGYLGRPEIKRVRNGNYDYDLTNQKPSNLLSVHDLYANVKYYINPNRKLPKYKAYGNKQDGPNYNLKQQDFSKLNNLFKVFNRDQSVTFIDSMGMELFLETYEDGQIISGNLMVLKRDGKFGLFRRQNQLTSFEYQNAPTVNEGGIFYLYKKLIPPTQEHSLMYYTYNAEGTLLDSSYSYPSIDRKLVLVNKNPGFAMYNDKGEKVLTHAEYEGSFTKMGSQPYIHLRTKNGQGLMTMKGEIIYKPEGGLTTNYSSKTVTMVMGQRAEVLDSMLNTVFAMDSVISLTPTADKKYFLFTVNRSWHYNIGLASVDDGIIVKAAWDRLEMAECENLLLLKRDTLNHVMRLHDQQLLVTLPDPWKLAVDCRSNLIIASKDKGDYQLYDFTGNLIKSGNINEDRDNYKFGPHKYRVVEEGKSFYLENKKGVKVLPSAYKDILALYDEHENRSVYICERNPKIHPSTEVYNDDLKPFLPAGYSVPSVWSYQNRINTGTLIVVNDADVNNVKYKFRVGICDYNGKWIIPPFQGTLKYVEPGLFILHDFEEMVVHVFDAKGKKTCEEDFFIVEKGNGSDFFQNRILVGILKDRNYLKQVEALQLEKLPMEVAVEKMETLGEPEMLYGYLNTKGKKVLDLKYTKAVPFSMTGITTTVAIERDGKQVSQVIDTSGNVIFEADFEEMEEIDSFYFKVKKDGKWALASRKGDVLTPFQFQELFFDSKNGFGTAEGDGERFIISADYKVLNLGKYYNAMAQKINGYYVVKLITQIPGSYTTTDKYAIYDKDFVMRAEIEGAKDIKGEYQNLPLAPGYLVVFKDYGGKDFYLFDVMRNKMMERK